MNAIGTGEITFFLIIGVVVFFLLRRDKRNAKKQQLKDINQNDSKSEIKVEPKLSKKELNINKSILMTIFYGFIIAFVSIVIVQHNGKIKGKYDQIYDGYDYVNNKHKWKMGEWYAELFSSPLGYGYPISISAKELYYINGTENYFTKLEVYIKATFYKFQYVLILGIIISAIILFFKRYRLKIK